MTQPELFNFHQAGNLTVIEPGLTPVVGRITQLTDRESLPPFARNSETSRQAAIAKHNAGDADNQRDRILRVLLFAPSGLTREEIETETGLDGNTVRPRIKELMSQAAGWQDRKPCVRVTGRTRPTRCGRQAEILEAI